MNPLLLFILQTTVVGSVLAALYLLLYPLHRRILSAGWQYNMVKTMSAFFILPVGLMNTLAKAGLSLWQQSFNTPSAADNVQPVTTMLTAPLGENMIQPLAPIVRPLAATLNEGTALINWSGLLFALWLSGALLFILHQGLSFWVFYRRIVWFNNSDGLASPEEIRLCNQIALRMGLRHKIAVAVNRKIDGPMVFFGKSNMVVLPSTPIAYEDLKYVFYHELTHIKRHDLLFKFFFLLVCAVHWFNPLFHILYRQLNIWCELSCDEAVVKNFSHGEKKEYGLSIINLMYTGKSMEKQLCSSYACHKKSLKRRLNMLIKQPKYKKSKMAFSLALTVLLASAALSSGVLAANLSANAAPGGQPVLSAATDKNVTVLEKSELSGRATKIQWNDKLFTIEGRSAAVSSDQGKTWEEYKADYESLKLVYSSLGIDFLTIEEYKAQVEEMRNTPPMLPNINPDAVSSWLENIEWREGVVTQIEKGETITEPVLLTKGINYMFIMPKFDQIYGENGEVIPNMGFSGLHLDELYELFKEQVNAWVATDFLTQEEANVIWQGFLKEYNLEK